MPGPARRAGPRRRHGRLVVQLQPDPFGHRDRLRRARARQKQDELLTAIPGEEIGIPQVGADDVGHLPQHLVAGQMPGRVVDPA